MAVIRVHGLPFLTLFLCSFVLSDYTVPEVAFEALEPRGLRISIPAEPKVQFFAFHGKLNQPIGLTEPGDFNEDVTRPENGRFTYFNPNIQLKPGDVINYWVFVQHDQLGYRRDQLKWTVNELTKQKVIDRDPKCLETPTTSSDRSVICRGEVLFEHRFIGSELNESVWLWEQYIPVGPDFEFVVYKKADDVTFLSGNLLHIRPKVTDNKADLIMSQDVSSGCTRTSPNECSREFFGIYQNPVTSGRIVAKNAFAFGKVEVRAKLPKGDWIYPEIYLEDIQDPKRKIWIAYARGNELLTGGNGDDLGGKLLFGGPVVSPLEPNRSRYLSSYRNAQPLANEMHTYKLTWTEAKMELHLDDLKYGEIPYQVMQESEFNKPRMNNGDLSEEEFLGYASNNNRNFPSCDEQHC
ncbi:beta-1,3-glucan-binding protein-like isoform X2 [Cylas formicarius]|uniref:beta-1,3-glucan-binding protein-like isoform X2 n=1 Tax=Cylas formicarius TaxID=197179 RepID=UPI002958C214|nr:beta-1,3-glucan-binding protein-like isoform X2 [Cylas formicarius]